MNEPIITITVEEYKELLRKAERIDTLERLYENTYVSDDDVKAVLGINENHHKGENQND